MWRGHGMTNTDCHDSVESVQWNVFCDLVYSRNSNPDGRNNTLKTSDRFPPSETNGEENRRHGQKPGWLCSVQRTSTAVYNIDQTLAASNFTLHLNSLHTFKHAWTHTLAYTKWQVLQWCILAFVFRRSTATEVLAPLPPVDADCVSAVLVTSTKMNLCHQRSMDVKWCQQETDPGKPSKCGGLCTSLLLQLSRVVIIFPTQCGRVCLGLLLCQSDLGCILRAGTWFWTLPPRQQGPKSHTSTHWLTVAHSTSGQCMSEVQIPICTTDYASQDSQDQVHSRSNRQTHMQRTAMTGDSTHELNTWGVNAM